MRQLLIPPGLDIKRIEHRFNTALKDPTEVYYACKELDGLSPAPAGTFPIWAFRVAKFYRFPVRQFFYEPLSTYQHLLDISETNYYILTGGAPIWARSYHSVTVEIFESSRNPPLGYLPIPKAGEKFRGLHCVGLTSGWKDSGECLQFQNSWGKRWGDNGFGWLSRNYIDQFMTEAWLMQNVRFGRTIYKFTQMEKASDAREYQRIWMIENPRWHMKFKFNSSGHQVVIYDALSVSSECPVDVIEIKNGNGGLICWAHLFHLSGVGPRISVLKEFFVWPWFRRYGYGGKLEEFACGRARMWGSEKIQVYFHQADTVAASHRFAGYHFSKKCGYSKNYQISKRPNLTAIGEKDLNNK